MRSINSKEEKTKRKRRKMGIALGIILLLIIGVILFLNQPSFGRLPRGERQEKIEKMENYHDGKFHNITPSSVMASDKSKLQSMWDFLFREIPNLRPDVNIPVVNTDLHSIDSEKDIVIWLGHSTLFIQLAGKRILVDPVLVLGSPVSFVNKAFEGADHYTPEDIPELDYILVTHDHWDHLDYKTVKALKDRTKKIICPLGVGEHFERWGFEQDDITELYWGETAFIDNSFTFHCFPARHFSGRGLSADKTLWASYMLQGAGLNVFISGDTGYDTHFKDIRTHFDQIDFAIMENGQYDEDWKDIHLMPDDLVQAVKDLSPQRFMTVHNSKYALGKHSWYEPLDKITIASQQDSLNLITPVIGQAVYLKNDDQEYVKWWKDL